MNNRVPSAQQIENAKKLKTDAGKAMYLAGKVRLSKADEVAAKARGGQGWVTR